MKHFPNLLLALLLPVFALAQKPDGQWHFDLPEGVVHEEYTYAVKGSDTLRLDFYHLENDSLWRPTVILSFAGGWFCGNRFSFPEAGRYVKRGYNVACIDYRLSLEQFEPMDSTVFGYKHARAITRALEDTYDATRYLIDNSAALGVDTSRIVLAGCSAGAINSVMAEYLLCNEDPLATGRLPQGFNYAAVVSGAGGIWKLGMGEPQWKNPPCPHFFIHGAADYIVPPEKVLLPDSNFAQFGTKAIAEIFARNNYPYERLLFEGGDHLLAALTIFNLGSAGYTVDYMEHIFNFLDRAVVRGERYRDDYYEKDYDVPRCQAAVREPETGLQQLSPYYLLPQFGKGDLMEETYTYAVKDGQQLVLDVYWDPSFAGPRPVFFYQTGGGWESANRRDCLSFLRFIASQGYVAVSMDYRLEYAKARKSGQVKDETIGYPLGQRGFEDKKMAKLMIKCINTGVEDLMDATTFVVKNASLWNADPSKIILCGGSAGAIDALTAEYRIVNRHSQARRHLPKGFQYAGLISLAGAIWHPLNEPLVWKSMPCPMMIVHGNADGLVPYIDDHYLQSGYAFTGDMALVESLERMKTPYMALTIEGGDHSYSFYPLENMQSLLAAFISRFAINREQAAVRISEKELVYLNH